VAAALLRHAAHVRALGDVFFFFFFLIPLHELLGVRRRADFATDEIIELPPRP